MMTSNSVPALPAESWQVAPARSAQSVDLQVAVVDLQVVVEDPQVAVADQQVDLQVAVVDLQVAGVDRRTERRGCCEEEML